MNSPIQYGRVNLLNKYYLGHSCWNKSKMQPQILSAAHHQVHMESPQPDQHFHPHQRQLPGGTNQDYSRNTEINS